MASPFFSSALQPQIYKQRTNPGIQPQADPRLPATQRFAMDFGIPPEAGFAVPHVLQFSGIVGSGWRTYYQGQYDEALRFSREDALAMRNDAFIMSLLEERKRAVATLNWHLEVDNPRDPWQKALADGLTQIAKNVPRQTDLTLSGLEALWYGRAGDQFAWKIKTVKVPAMPKTAAGGGLPTISVAAHDDQYEERQVYCLVNHQAVEGDKIGYDYDGTPYVMVSPMVDLEPNWRSAEARYQNGNKWQQEPPPATFPPLKADHAQIGFTTAGGKAIFLKGNWRSRFRIHHHMMLDTSFWQPWKADGIHGIGIRSVIFWYWWLRQEFLANVTDWCARAGLGFRLWYYEQGNNTSKLAVEKAAREQSDKVNVMVPYDPSQPNRPAVDVIETSGTGADTLLKIVKHVEDYIERYIVGQNMTGGSDEFSMGFGDKGRSELASRTNWQITKLDAKKFADTNTTDYFDVVKKWSYPDLAEIPCRQVFDVDDPDISKWVEGAKSFVDFGGKIVEDEARAKLGLSKPRSSDTTLGGREALQMKQATSGHVKPPDGVNPGTPENKPGESAPTLNGDVKTPSRFAELQLAQRYNVDASGHEHAPPGQPTGGQFTGKAEHGQSPDQMAAHFAKPVLSKEEQDKLVVDHLPLVDEAARAAIAKGISSDYDSLFSDAQMALINAASKFDPAKGVPFEHLANKAMKNRLLNTKAPRTTSLSGEEGQIDVEATREQPANLPQMSELDNAIAKLPEQSRAIMEMRKAGKKSREIAEQLGMPHATVRTIQNRAMEQIRSMVPHSEVLEFKLRYIEEEQADDYGHWITMGGHPGANGQHEGGHHVELDEQGRILNGGPPEWRGKMVHEALNATKAAQSQPVAQQPAQAQSPQQPQGDPQVAAQHVATINGLLQRATDSTLEYAQIEAGLQPLASLDLPTLQQVARDLKMTMPSATMRSRKGIFEEIRRRVRDRKGSFERANFRPEPPNHMQSDDLPDHYADGRSPEYRRHHGKTIEHAIERLKAIADNTEQAEIDEIVQGIARQFTVEELRELAREFGVQGSTKGRIIENIVNRLEKERHQSDEEKSFYDECRRMIEEQL